MSKPIEGVEIITGRERRRRYSAEEKVRLVEETMQPDHPAAKIHVENVSKQPFREDTP